MSLIMGTVVAVSTLIVGLVLTNLFLLFCLTPDGKQWLRQHNML